MSEHIATCDDATRYGRVTAPGTRWEAPVKLDQARYEVATETSTYLIDIPAMRASRSKGGAGVVPGQDFPPVHKNAWATDFVLLEVPTVQVGEPMRLEVLVAGRPTSTPVVTTRVRTVRRLET